MRLLISVLVATSAACVLPMNSADIAAANARHVQRLCTDPNYAYETGYNAGLDRQRLDTSWADTGCTPDVAAMARNRYQSGYQAGIQNAPLVVPVGRGGGSISVVESCTFSSDCGEGRTCRSNQCMGNGYAGDACWFSSDCVSDSCDVSRKTCN